MNEFLELVKSFPLYSDIRPMEDALTAWFMNLSIFNFVCLGLIAFFSVTLTLEASRSKTINGVTEERVNRTPMYLVNTLVVVLMYFFPQNLMYALIPHLTVVGLLTMWPTPLLRFVGLFQPKEF